MTETYGSFDCRNCGRSQVRTQRSQQFCPRNENGTSCKDRYWSRGTRRVSKLNIQVGEILNVLQTTVETSALLLNRIEKLEIRMVPLKAKVERLEKCKDIFEGLSTEQVLKMIEDFMTDEEPSMTDEEMFELSGVKHIPFDEPDKK